jgi:uncharacterized phage protein (TIGR02218 family)
MHSVAMMFSVAVAVPLAPMAAIVAPGDAFVVTAGCDKSFATCRDRYGNFKNFRGFPHIPGNDFLVSPASAGGSAASGEALVP